MPSSKKIGLFLGPLLFLVLYNIDLNLINPIADKVLAVAVWMIVWWVTEAVGIAVTALIPLAIFPLVQIMDIKAVGANYGSHIVFLFFGGFVMALALEKVNLHRRIALNIIKLTRVSPNNVILGFMIATAFLSMWISNTATTVVMLPIAASVIQLLMKDQDGFSSKDKNFALSLMLCIAYAANVGGIATIIGTPPNTVMIGFVEKEYDIQISFLNWMIIGVPFSILMLGIIYLIVVKIVYPNHLPEIGDARGIIQRELDKLGQMSHQEKRVLLIFLITIFLWITRTYLKDLLPAIQLSDAGISMLAVMMLFAIPLDLKADKFLLEWKDTVKLPWGILLLFGGGLALASALSKNGVIDFIGGIVAQNQHLPVFWVLVILVGIMLFATELMSNVALVAIFAPVVAGIALGLEQEVMHFLIPVTISSSCAFMLPMATPPNAIVFASGYISVNQMVKAGFFLNLIAVFLILLFAHYVIPLLF